LHGPVEVLRCVPRTAGADERLAQVVLRPVVVRIRIDSRLEPLDGPIDVARRVGVLPREQLGNGRGCRVWGHRRRGWRGDIGDRGLSSSCVWHR
jgi:hypothetical protein